jgi:trans-aconitate methyltransferase
MGLAATAYRQFHRPSGLLGSVAGWIMAHRPSNVARNRWTVDLLQVEERDHVLEIGFGPGLALEAVARRAPRGRVVGIDHSALMVRLARRRNPGVDLRLGGIEHLAQLGETFDKVFSVNVLQFLRDRSGTLGLVRAALKPGGIAATTVQLRRPGATADDAGAFAQKLSEEMIQAGFRDVIVHRLDLKPVPAMCVLARR